jgi:hypothetical protein
MSDDAKHTYRDIVNMIKEIEHIDSTEKFLEVCVERITDKNLKTNDKLYIIASAINMINEFIIAESRYSRSRMNDIHTLLSKVKITQDING